MKAKMSASMQYQKQKIHFNISERKCSFRYDCDLYYFKYFHCCVHICNFLVCRSVGSKGKDFSWLGLPQ